MNEEKTRIARSPEGEFDFLGYTFGRMYSPTTGKPARATGRQEEHQAHGPKRVHALTDRARNWQGPQSSSTC